MTNDDEKIQTEKPTSLSKEGINQRGFNRWISCEDLTTKEKEDDRRKQFLAARHFFKW